MGWWGFNGEPLQNFHKIQIYVCFAKAGLCLVSALYKYSAGEEKSLDGK